MVMTRTNQVIYESSQLVEWQAVEDVFANGGILIGNGFSQAVWENFGYKSIYDAACSSSVFHPLTSNDQRLFKLMHTSNFELVLSNLSKTSEMVQTFGKEYEYLEERYEYIKAALGEAIQAVHVSWHEVPDDTFTIIRKALRHYKHVYSTNYDLLPYWAIMSEREGRGFKDYFWGRDDGNRHVNPYFDIADADIFDDSATRILYLHGALHLYRDPHTERTHKLKNRSRENLLSITDVPLFITEGDSSDKLRAIRNSDYLFFAYNQFLAHSGPLVVFGHSLDNDKDRHLVDAIRKAVKQGSVDKLAFSIRGSKSPEQIMQRKSDLRRTFCDGLRDKPELIFFDAQTHPLGSSDIRIEDRTEALSIF